MRDPLLQIPLLIVSIVMILHGLFGPTLAPEESGDHSDLGSLSRGAGAGPAGGGQLLLPGVPVHAGAPGSTALLPPG